jgi:hypothetical protein
MVNMMIMNDMVICVEMMPIIVMMDHSGLVSCSIVKYLLKGYVTERMGEREDMQDAHVIMDDFKTEFNDDEFPQDV